MSCTMMTFSRWKASLLTLRQACLVQMHCVRTYCSQPLPIHKAKAMDTDEEAKHFVDYKKVKVKGGNGGNGVVRFTRYKFREFAGPDGGDGGNGGHVIFTVDDNVKSLSRVQSSVTAAHGKAGKSCYCTGKSADHVFVKVPRGTIFKDSEESTLAVLDQPGDYYVAAHGGAGGRGNYAFLTNEDRAPLKAEVGGEGEERVLHVELQIMAHAGLIGFPNAGKSTLLRAISRARPAVSPYPFTTLNPHVGTIEYDDFVQVTVADIPGLVRGSHANQGLGFSFLKHVTRCACLLYVVDVSQSEPWTQLSHLQEELEHYQKGLSLCPHAVVANKMDLPHSEENLALMKNLVTIPIVPVSALRGTGIRELLVFLRTLCGDHVNRQE